MANHIIAVGISNYQGVRHLQYADKDAKEFYFLFERNVGDIGYKRLLVDSEASLAAIRNALGAGIEENLGNEDTFYFFFSGHGAIAKSQDGSGFSNYLLPFDASQDVVNTCISIEYLKDRFSKIQCKNKLIIIDSCFSGSINSKAYTRVNLKSLKDVKTFQNTLSGKGQITFTASKEDEEAIEDLELENGLFTHYFLEELQKETYGERVPILSIHAPVTENVISRAKERHNFDQTPTFKGDLEGVVYLPVFKKRLVITPQEIEIATHPELSEARIPLPEIKIEDEKLLEDIQKLVELVIKGSSADQKYANITLEKNLVSAIRNLRESYEDIFKSVGNDVSKIPESVTRLEAESFYIQLIGCVIAAFGNQDQMANYTERIGEILGFGEGKSGLTALIDMPEIILVDIIYSVGIICLINNSLELFGTLLNTKIYDSNRMQYLEFYKRYDIHYSSSLGGQATKVGDHVRDTLENNVWLTALCPQLEGKIVDYQLQLNLLLGAFCYSHDIGLFADYGRFYGKRVMPLVARIRDDVTFRRKVADFLEKEEDSVIDFLKEYLDKARDKMYSGFWWNSVNSGVFEGKVDFL